MSVADEAVRRALGQLASGGGATVWRPTLTTGQAARTPALEARMARARGGAAQTFNADAFLVWYVGDVLPTGDDPAWTADLTGAAEAAASGGVLTVTADAAGESLLYAFPAPTLSNARGTTLEARVRVTSSASGANTGSALCIMDGVYQFVVWLRADGLNIDGQAHVACDLATSFRRVTLQAQNARCSVKVDGYLRQTGTWMNRTTKKAITFGSWATEDITLE